ncbi:MAG: hypothetical protein Q9M97_03730 [Candidatus Gracilibacteria bacterium]|nr:hypothetical protein [Candidatus Gracilibacteria bacterium]
MEVLEKKRKGFAEDYRSIEEPYTELDEQHAEYLSGNAKTYTVEEVWEKFLKRKNTFLTSK